MRMTRAASKTPVFVIGNGRKESIMVNKAEACDGAPLPFEEESR